MIPYDKLRGWLEDEKLSYGAIARTLKTNISVVQYWAEKYQLKSTHKFKRNIITIPTKERLEELLIRRKLTYKEAAKECSMHETTLKQISKKLGVKSLYKKGERKQLHETGDRIIFEKKISSCYLKEARAIIRGEHWEGKNRCTYLPGDEELVWELWNKWQRF